MPLFLPLTIVKSKVLRSDIPNFAAVIKFRYKEKGLSEPFIQHQRTEGPF